MPHRPGHTTGLPGSQAWLEENFPSEPQIQEPYEEKPWGFDDLPDLNQMYDDFVSWWFENYGPPPNPGVGGWGEGEWVGGGLEETGWYQTDPGTQWAPGIGSYTDPSIGDWVQVPSDYDYSLEAWYSWLENYYQDMGYETDNLGTYLQTVAEQISNNFPAGPDFLEEYGYMDDLLGMIDYYENVTNPNLTLLPEEEEYDLPWEVTPDPDLEAPHGYEIDEDWEYAEFDLNNDGYFNYDDYAAFLELQEQFGDSPGWEDFNTSFQQAFDEVSQTPGAESSIFEEVEQEYPGIIETPGPIEEVPEGLIQGDFNNDGRVDELDTILENQLPDGYEFEYDVLLNEWLPVDPDTGDSIEDYDYLLQPSDEELDEGYDWQWYPGNEAIEGYWGQVLDDSNFSEGYLDWEGYEFDLNNDGVIDIEDWQLAIDSGYDQDSDFIQEQYDFWLSGQDWVEGGEEGQNQYFGNILAPTEEAPEGFEWVSIVGSDGNYIWDLVQTGIEHIPPEEEEEGLGGGAIDAPFYYSEEELYPEDPFKPDVAAPEGYQWAELPNGEYILVVSGDEYLPEEMDPGEAFIPTPDEEWWIENYDFDNDGEIGTGDFDYMLEMGYSQDEITQIYEWISAGAVENFVDYTGTIETEEQLYPDLSEPEGWFWTYNEELGEWQSIYYEDPGEEVEVEEELAPTGTEYGATPWYESPTGGWEGWEQLPWESQQFLEQIFGDPASWESGEYFEGMNIGDIINPYDFQSIQDAIAYSTGYTLPTDAMSYEEWVELNVDSDLTPWDEWGYDFDFLTGETSSGESLQQYLEYLSTLEDTTAYFETFGEWDPTAISVMNPQTMEEMELGYYDPMMEAARAGSVGQVMSSYGEGIGTALDAAAYEEMLQQQIQTGLMEPYQQIQRSQQSALGEAQGVMDEWAQLMAGLGLSTGG